MTQCFVQHSQFTARRTYTSIIFRCAGPKEIQSIHASVCPSFPKALYLKKKLRTTEKNCKYNNSSLPEIKWGGGFNFVLTCTIVSANKFTRVGTLILATIYLQLIQNRCMFRSFTVLHCSHQHCVQPVASDVEVVGYL